MKPKWNGQADLFERRPTMATPSPEIRMKLGTLLQLLLREAASLGHVEGRSGVVAKEVGHEPDHG